MEIQDPQRYQMVDSFLQSIKHTQNKQQFLSKVHDFDTRFIDDHSAPSMPEKQKSVEKLPPMPQEKPRNPFKTNVDDSFRHQAMMQTAQQSPFVPQPQARGQYRTEQNFYRPPTGSGIKNQPPQPPHHMAQNYGYQEPRNSQSQMNQYGGGMGVLNYNAFSQKEYDELKDQFFRAPNMARPPMDYNRMNEDNLFNFGHMAQSSSSDILPGETSFSRPTPRGYPERVNPFMKN